MGMVTVDILCAVPSSYGFPGYKTNTKDPTQQLYMSQDTNHCTTHTAK